MQMVFWASCIPHRECLEAAANTVLQMRNLKRGLTSEAIWSPQVTLSCLPVIIAPDGSKLKKSGLSLLLLFMDSRDPTHRGSPACHGRQSLPGGPGNRESAIGTRGLV